MHSPVRWRERDTLHGNLYGGLRILQRLAQSKKSKDDAGIRSRTRFQSASKRARLLHAGVEASAAMLTRERKCDTETG